MERDLDMDRAPCDAIETPASPAPRRRRHMLRTFLAESLPADATCPTDHPRPATRAECEPGGALHLRPCPYVGRKHHLFLDPGRAAKGSVRFAFPGKEPHEIPASCSLDEAARGGHTLDEVGARMGMTRERTRQLEASGLAKVSDALRELGVSYRDLTVEDLRRDLGEPKPPTRKYRRRNRRKAR
jgi:hypothetical protein